jgi:preprotein translocase subunit SecA
VLNTALKAIFGSRNDRLLKEYRRKVEAINALEKDFEKLSDEQLQAKTPELKERVGKGESLVAVLPEAFATVREASKRVLGMRHFDVQMVGGIVLQRGEIAE